MQIYYQYKWKSFETFQWYYYLTEYIDLFEEIYYGVGGQI